MRGASHSDFSHSSCHIGRERNPFNFRSGTVCNRHRRYQYAFNFVTVLPVGDDEDGKVSPEVVITALCYRSVIINSVEKRWCFADVVRLIVTEKDVHAWFLQTLLDRGSARNQASAPRVPARWACVGGQMRAQEKNARVIKKLVRAAKNAMKILEYYLPESEHGQAWSALSKVVRSAEPRPVRRKSRRDV